MNQLYRTGTFKLLALVILLHVAGLAYLAYTNSPTLDEPAHLASGLMHLSQRDFTWYRVNPPLIRSVAALPAYLQGVTERLPKLDSLDYLRPEFALGESLISELRQQSQYQIFLARLMCIPFSILGALVCYAWGRDLYGPSAGIAACILWCASPMVLGHASLITPDAHSASLGVFACYSFWLWLCQPTWKRAFLSGVILGVAELAKTTLIVLIPLWPVLWLIYRYMQREANALHRWRQEITMLFARTIIAIYIINLGYLGQGSCIPLEEYRFKSELFSGQHIPRNQLLEQSANRFADTWLGKIPVPLPADYLLGIDLQQVDFEQPPWPSYIHGRFSSQGFWYYYALGAIYKASTGTILLVCIAFLRRRHFKRAQWRDELAIWLPLVFMFIVVSSKTGFSGHLRYAFPCLPLLLVAISSAFKDHPHRNTATTEKLNARQREPLVVRLRRFTPHMLLACCVLSSLLTFPYSLSYFNEIVGGWRQGPRYLLGSNHCWGQDLQRLHGFANRSLATIHVAVDSTYNPLDYLASKQFQTWPDVTQISNLKLSSGSAETRWFAIDTQVLYSGAKNFWNSDRRSGTIALDVLNKLQRTTPRYEVGSTIRIYSLDQIQQAYR